MSLVAVSDGAREVRVDGNTNCVGMVNVLVFNGETGCPAEIFAVAT